MSNPLEPAPFGVGDRVIFRPRPAGVETIELIEFAAKAGPGWYVRSRREVGPTGTSAHRYGPAADFDPAVPAAEPAGLPVGGVLRRLFRRLCRGRARASEAAAERAGAVAGWPPVDRGGLAGLDRAVGDGR
jgi:hypothetical protein